MIDDFVIIYILLIVKYIRNQFLFTYNIMFCLSDIMLL